MEALVGAALVLFGWVDKNQSLARVISIAVHLTNTFLLLAALALTAWWSSWGREFNPRKPQGSVKTRITVSWIATLLVGMTGAITALGDTLFHSASLTQGIAQDFSETSHFLLKLRVFHPFFALMLGAWLFYFAEKATGLHSRLDQLATVIKALVAGQLLLGLVNLILLAPTGLQLAHLFVAESLWVTLVLASVTLACVAPEPRRAIEPQETAHAGV
jgi:cytochrome c oxidase assembly protein subunit 15/protoheme IX farnesyltransferase